MDRITVAVASTSMEEHLDLLDIIATNISNIILSWAFIGYRN
jgi:hypothetical protein